MSGRGTLCAAIPHQRGLASHVHDAHECVRTFRIFEVQLVPEREGDGLLNESPVDGEVVGVAVRAVTGVQESG